MTEEIGPWAQLCKGYRYDYTNGVIHGDLSIRDLAWTMAHLPRYNAWTDLCVWSLTSHGCLVAEILAANADNPPSVILGGLHHDDHEVFSGDLLSPFLWSLPPEAAEAIKLSQAKMQRAIERKLGIWGEFGCDSSWGAKIKAADLAALEAERRFLFSERLTWGTEQYVDQKMLADAERVIRGDFGKINYGPLAAERFISRHEALVKLAIRS